MKKKNLQIPSVLLTVTMILGMLMNFPVYQAQAAETFTTTPMISAGDTHTAALKSDGTVWAWGNNEDGQLGDGTTTDRRTPVQVQNLTNVMAVSAGDGHTTVLKNDGTVWSWGSDWYGQLGDG
ncbi:MAG: RCC1 domain-containing protein, alpha-tubulin suppressor, partial [Oscillospiraceae bacterium]|nr:RCC1 domain-containing protein, alpha-tubulin suppressor [Oscillospiraceae bacterium]